MATLKKMNPTFFKDLAKKLELSEKEFRTIGKKLTKSIRTRTLSGRDVEQSTFTPYAFGSKKSGIPNLKNTGRMLKSVKQNTKKNELTLSTNVNYSKYHQRGTPKMAKRKWFGLTHQDINWVAWKITGFLRKKLEK